MLPLATSALLIAGMASFYTGLQINSGSKPLQLAPIVATNSQQDIGISCTTTRNTTQDLL
jgi:hypothetical protein